MHTHRHDETGRKRTGSDEKSDKTEINRRISKTNPRCTTAWRIGDLSLPHKLKKINIMWFAILIFVCLSVEVLSYLTGGDTSNGIIRTNEENSSPETV
jgi:hypothetical protein